MLCAKIQGYLLENDWVFSDEIGFFNQSCYCDWCEIFNWQGTALICMEAMIHE